MTIPETTEKTIVALVTMRWIEGLEKIMLVSTDDPNRKTKYKEILMGLSMTCFTDGARLMKEADQWVPDLDGDNFMTHNHPVKQ